MAIPIFGEFLNEQASNIDRDITVTKHQTKLAEVMEGVRLPFEEAIIIFIT